MIKFENVTKKYRTPSGHKVILDQVNCDLDCERGIAILGMNGAGKSTLVRMISGTELPDSGRIIKTGGSVSWPMGLSGTFQPSMTGGDNVRFAAQIYGMDADEVLDKVARFSDLNDYMDMPVSSYSNGMKSRLAFGLSLAVSFDIYLIDEIIAVGDRLFKKKSKEMLQKCVKDSKIVLISHQESTIREFCDRCAILRHGRLEVFDSMDAAFKEFNAIEVR